MIAEITYTDKVTITVLDSRIDAEALVRSFFERGVISDAKRRRVRAGEEPEAFMEALVEPRNSSYSWYEDHSDAPEE